MFSPVADLEKKMTPRFRGLIDQLNPDLATWDLCCDHGIVGLLALCYKKTPRVVFVDRQRHLMDRLEIELDNLALQKTHYEVRCADINLMQIGSKPVNYIIAGVGTNLILQFLSRVQIGQGHRVICNTHQNPDRFERLVRDSGLIWEQKTQVVEKKVMQSIWVFQL